MRHAISPFLIVVLALGLVVGCSGSDKEYGSVGESGAPDSASGAERAETTEEAMEPEGVAATADELRAALTEKRARLQEIADELKGMSPTDLMGEAAKRLQSESDTLAAEIAALEQKIEASEEE